MQPDLNGINLAVLGGDAREIILAEQLAELGASVKSFGLPVNNKSIVQCGDLLDTVDSINALILPVPGINEEMKLYSAYLNRPVYVNEDVFSRLSRGCPVLVGVAKPALKNLVKKFDLRLVEVMDNDEVAILNSIPSAEGALQIAMEKMPITIHGCSAAVLGFGRTGITLARLLKALGAVTTVFARNPSQVARAVEMGLNTASFSRLKKLKHVDVIFNTVPAKVLTREVLESLPARCLIIDLASAPGGTDFEVAKMLGLEALLTPGLPGKVAPESAGRILARTVPRLLVKELTLQ